MATRLLLCLLAYSALASTLPEAEVSTDWNSRYHQNPTSWSGLRIQVHYNETKVASAAMDHLRNEVIGRVVRWYERVLQVPAVSGPVKVPLQYCVQGLVPASHNLTGVSNADVVLYVVTVPSTTSYYEETNAYGAPCLLSGAVPNRVLAGALWLRMDWLTSLSLENQIQAVTKAVAQTLAFNPVLFPYFSKPDDTYYHVSEVLKFASLGNVGAYFITLPTVVKRARAAFACATLPGVRLAEYSHTSRNFTSVWSSRMMLDDFMSDVTANRPSYSDVTMAVFQDSGWYSVQWEYTNPVQFLYRKGCSAFTAACISGGVASNSAFCVGGTDLCGASLNTKGNCGVFTYQYGLPSPFAYLTNSMQGGYREMDYCPVVTEGETCLEGTTAVTGEEKCSECRCLIGTYQSSNSHCFKVTCNGGQATVRVGIESVLCPTAGGAVTLPNSLGSVTCPAVESVCNTAPCKNLCSGFGRCSRSGCLCENGHSGGDCSISCDTTCENCSGAGANACTSCRPGATLVGNACVCDSGLTMNSVGVCAAPGPCHGTCLTCSGALATQCTSCYSPAAVGGTGACQCPEGSALNGLGRCVDCASECRSCQAATPSVCLSCYGNISLDSGSCPCSAGSYFDVDLFECLSCQSPCTTCANTPTNCVSCPVGLALLSGQCGCAAGTYLNNGGCSPCHANCLTCNNPTEADCLSCRSEAYLVSLPSPCYCRTGAGSCTLCRPGCLTCAGPGLVHCASCHSNASVEPFTKKCYCNAGFFPNPDVTNCMACHSTCESCYGADSKSCLTCPKHSYMSGSSCSCESKYFLDESTQTCSNCPDYCKGCRAGLCLGCIPGFAFDLDVKCALLDGYVLDIATNSTYTCPNGCKHCTLQLPVQVPVALTCIECFETLELTPANICQCAGAQYYESQLGACTNCPDSKCLKCQSVNSCQTCEAPFLVQAYSFLCTCPAGQYRSAGQCLPCHSTCLTCAGGTSQDCNSCYSTAFLYSPAVGRRYCTCLTNDNAVNCEPIVCDASCLTCSGPYNYACTSCRGNAYLSPPTTGYCACMSPTNPTTCATNFCHYNCLTCNGNTNAQCTSCYPSAYLSGNRCVCLPNGDQTRCEALACHSTCYTCSGYTELTCLSCYPDGLLTSDTCPCTPNIMSGSNCRNCKAECQDCNGTGGCRSCRHSLAYIPANQPGQCICRKSFPDPTAVNCTPCHKTCEECSGPGLAQCTACHVYGVLTAGTCECSGLTIMLSTGYCFQGSFYCATANCSTCRNNALREYFNTESQAGNCNCYSQMNSGILPTNNYPDTTAGVCYRCSRLCAQCAIESDLCIYCGSHSSLVRLTELLPSGYCVCNQGYYESDEDCLRCPKGCEACSTISQCSRCAYGYELKLSGGQRTCECVTAACGRCPDNTFLLKQTGLCEAGCPSGFVAQDGVCKDSGKTKFTWQFNSAKQPYYDSTGNFKLETSNSYPLYQRGLNVLGSYVYLKQSNLILGPTFYVEVWSYGAGISINRSVNNSTMYINNFFQSWWGHFFMQDSERSNIFVSLNSQETGLSTVQNSVGWQRIRFELITEVKGTSIITTNRISQNDVVIAESSIRNYYYFERSDNPLQNFFGISFNSNPYGAFLAEITLANQVWVPVSTPCSCPLCTSGGYCLSSCLANQYPSGTTCGACLPSCSQGCVRGSDCTPNLDPLCTSFSNFTSCQACQPLTILKNGICSCQPHAKFLTSNSTCVCEDNYKLSAAGFCAKCLNYIKPEDVSAEIEENFMSLTVSFEKRIPDASDRCSELFTSQTVARFGEEASCSWSSNRKRLTVLFGKEATLMVEEVELNYEVMLTNQGPCSFDAIKLQPIAKYKGNMPVPVPALRVPEKVALACGGTKKPSMINAQGTSGGKGRKLLYKWSFTHSTLGPVFPSYNNYSDLSSLSLSLDTLMAGNLTVTVTAKNAFQKEASRSAQIRLSDSRALTLQLETGAQLTITSQDQGQVRVQVTDSCGLAAGVRAFQWNFLSVSPPLSTVDSDPSQVLQASNSPAVLFVRKNTLAAGHSYVYEAVVTQAGVQGSTTLNITVLPSNLVFRLNRVSGSHPSDMVLRLDGSLSTDPDKSAAAMKYQWVCYEGTNACKDAAGAPLVTSASTDVQLIQPDKLREGATYNFTLTVSKDSRQATGYVVMTIVAPTGCNVALKPFSTKVNSGYPLSILAEIATNLEVNFLWRQTAGPSAEPTGLFTFAYLTFRADALFGGKTYAFELTAKTLKGNLIAAFDFYVNRGPVGGKTVVTPSSGRALLDQFLLATEGWEDPEGDYPLYYQFCLSKGTLTPVCVSGLSVNLWSYMRLYPGTLTITAKAFDKWGAQAQSTALVDVSTIVRRQLQDLISTFQEDIQEAENTCGIIVVYCQSTVVSESLYTLMTTALKSYIQSLNQLDLKSVDSVLGAVEALAGEPPAKQENNAADLLSLLSSTVKNCIDSLTFASIQRALTIISLFSSSTSDTTRLAAAQTASQVLTLFTSQRLPNEVPTTFSSALLTSYAARMTGGLMGKVTIDFGNNATVTAPMGWLNQTTISSTDIIDIYGRTYRLNSSFAWVVELALQQAGSYAGYNVALTTPADIVLAKLAVSLNVTVPITSLPADSTLECLVKRAGNWEKDCEVVEIRNNSVVISSFYVAPITLRAVSTHTSPDSVNPTVVIPDSDSDCELNPTPLSIACALFLLAAAGLGLSLLLGKDKANVSRPVDNLSMDSHPIAHEISEMDQSKQPIDADMKPSAPVQPAPQPKGGFMQFQLLFSCIYFPSGRIQKLWTLVSTVQVEALVLGLCYSFWDDSSDHASSAHDVFSSYAGIDLAYVAIALAIGGSFCGVVQVLGMHRAVSGVSGTLALGGVIYLNVEQCCYSEGGRWGEGLLWTVLLQLLVLETAKAGVQLLWSRQRVSTN